MRKPLVIAARQSALARIQAEAVAEALQAAHPDLPIRYEFRASLGDQRADEPLWQMPEKGVFTADFRAGLLSGEFDLVVHSWKDLPLNVGTETKIAATLPRADQRDVLLVRRDRWPFASDRNFTLLTSSPRRAVNLANALPWMLPAPIGAVHCVPVRGNISTRIGKLVNPLQASEAADGLIVAKAALDRLLSARGEGYASMQTELRAALAQCRWMVLPLSVNPTAPAQGALAIEIAASRSDLAELGKSVNCSKTFALVQRERAILAAHGGGCHQPLGASVLRRACGEITFVSRLANDGKFTLENHLEPIRPRTAAFSRKYLWPLNSAENEWFTRQSLADYDTAALNAANALWIAKSESLPENYRVSNQQIVWAGGCKTWERLAQRGVWVNGCSDGLGETEAPLIETLAGQSLWWLKLTHVDAATLLPSPGLPTTATYRLIAKDNTPDLHGREMFFWTSGSNFIRALTLHPWLREKVHACGPGHTQTIIERAGLQPHIFLSRADWLREMALEAED